MHSIGRGSAATRLLYFGFEYCRGHRYPSLSKVVCCQVEGRAVHPSRGVLTNVVRLSVIGKPPYSEGPGPLQKAVTPWEKIHPLPPHAFKVCV